MWLSIDIWQIFEAIRRHNRMPKTINNWTHFPFYEKLVSRNRPNKDKVSWSLSDAQNSQILRGGYRLYKNRKLQTSLRFFSKNILSKKPLQKMPSFFNFIFLAIFCFCWLEIKVETCRVCTARSTVDTWICVEQVLVNIYLIFIQYFSLSQDPALDESVFQKTRHTFEAIDFPTCVYCALGLPAWQNCSPEGETLYQTTFTRTITSAPWHFWNRLQSWFAAWLICSE